MNRETLKQSIAQLREYANTVTRTQFVKFVVDKLAEGPYKADKATTIVCAVYREHDNRENIRAMVSEFYLTPSN